MRNQSVYDRIDYSLKSEAFQEKTFCKKNKNFVILLLNSVKAPQRALYEREENYIKIPKKEIKYKK